MNKHNVELHFNINSPVWLTEKNSAGGLRLLKGIVNEIHITEGGVEYSYNHEGEQCTFKDVDVGKYVFCSIEEANGHYSKEFNEIFQKYGEFTAIFFKVRKKISAMPCCKHLNAGAKHCIATQITYDICDALNKTEPLSRDDTITYLIDGTTEEKVNVVIEVKELENGSENIIAEKTRYKKTFAYIDTKEDIYVICCAENTGENVSTKPLAKIFKNGVIMYIEKSQNDPAVNKLIEEVINSHF